MAHRLSQPALIATIVVTMTATSSLVMRSQADWEHVAQTDPASPSQPRLAEDGLWYEPNRAALETWLTGIAMRDWEVPPVAVFDWDNTCIYGDVGYATFRYQLEQLALGFDPESLAEFLPEEVNGVTTLASGATLADARLDILDAFAVIWPYMQAGDLETVVSLPEYQDFRAKVGWLYEQLELTEGIGPPFAFRWLAAWLGGHTRTDAEQIVREAVSLALSEAPGRLTWTSATEGRVGHRECSFGLGIRPHAEMVDLMELMQASGLAVFVVSASNEVIVETAAELLGFPLAREEIFGIRLVSDDDRLTARWLPEDEYPVTYRDGKVQVIAQEIHRHPVFAAGDADTDFEMLTAIPTVEVRLIINRNKWTSDIAQLYRVAASGESNDPITLLQGRDENVGEFQSLRETTSMGESQPTSLTQD